MQSAMIMGLSYANRGLEGQEAARATRGCRLLDGRMSCHHEMVTKSDNPDAIRKARVAGIAEWYAAGLTRAELRSLVRSGDLVRVWHAVYATKPAVEWAKASPARGHALLAMAARVALGRRCTRLGLPSNGGRPAPRAGTRCWRWPPAPRLAAIAWSAITRRLLFTALTCFLRLPGW